MTLLLLLGSCGPTPQEPQGRADRQEEGKEQEQEKKDGNEEREESGAGREQQGGTSQGESSSRKKAVSPATLEQLAAQASCDLDVNVDAEEIRQGVCGSGRARYVLAMFATAAGRAAWLAEAKPYGGTYLVGGRWVAVGEEAKLAALRAKLGGAVERGDTHTPDGPDGSDHEGHDGHGEGHGEGSAEKDDGAEQPGHHRH